MPSARLGMKSKPPPSRTTPEADWTATGVTFERQLLGQSPHEVFCIPNGTESVLAEHRCEVPGGHVDQVANMSSGQHRGLQPDAFEELLQQGFLLVGQQGAEVDLQIEPAKCSLVLALHPVGGGDEDPIESLKLAEQLVDLGNFPRVLGPFTAPQQAVDLVELKHSAIPVGLLEGLGDGTLCAANPLRDQV